MNYRLATILAREAHAADTTKVVDIDIKDPISQIQVIYECTNGGAAFSTGHPVRCVTKIEIVDGSEVLFSLSGAEAQAADYYHNQRETASVVLYLNGMNSEQIMNINFGRFLLDPLLALDPAKFSNLQLKITLDVDAGGSASAGGYLTVLANIFDEKEISPVGFLMHKEIKSYTMAAASHEYTDLPIDYPYRKLFLRAQTYGAGPEYRLGNVKLSEDADKKVPLNHTGFQLLRMLTGQIKPYREGILLPGAAAAQHFHCTPSYWPVFAATGWRAAIGGGDKNCFEGDGGRFQFVQTAGGPNAQVLVEGWAPHGVIEIPFGRQNEIDDWYNVSGIGNLKLDIEGHAAVGAAQTAQIFLQQKRTY